MACILLFALPLAWVFFAEFFPPCIHRGAGLVASFFSASWVGAAAFGAYAGHVFAHRFGYVFVANAAWFYSADGCSAKRGLLSDLLARESCRRLGFVSG